MKIVRFVLPLLTLCATLPVAGLRAQTASPAPTSTPSVSAPASTTKADAGDDEEKQIRSRLSVLTLEEKQTLRRANKAAKNDPAVKAVEAEKSTNKRAYNKAVREAMIRSDSNVGPIFDKLRAARKAKRQQQS